MGERNLNLGCGNDYRPGWVNLDVGECKVDVSHDLEIFPYPFADGEFNRIDGIQVLEHIHPDKFASVVRELYRISAAGATWYITVPHGLSDNFITDPTHRMHFSTRTFDYFVDATTLRELGLIYGWGDVRLEYLRGPALDGNYSIHFWLKVKK